MVDEDATLELSDLILEHIGRYRISFLPVLEQVFGELGNVRSVVGQLRKKGLLVAHGRQDDYGNILGGYTAYQLTAKGTRQAGFTVKRSKALNENALESSFRMLWLCCMGTPRYSCLEKKHLVQLFDSPLKSQNGLYCRQMTEPQTVYRVRLMGPNSEHDHTLRETHKDLAACRDHPGVGEFSQNGRYGNILVVSKPERRKQLEQRVNSQGLKKLGHVRVALVPDLAEIKGAFDDR